MSEVLSNTGAKLWSETDYNELWLTVFDQLTGQGGKSNIRLIDEAIGKINATLDGYKFEFSSDEDRLYISKGDSKLPVSLIDSNGHVASKVDGTTITIDESGVVKGIPVDDALSEESTNPLQNKVIAGELKSIKSKMGTDESAIKQNTSDITSNTKRIEANETAISTLNGTGDGSVKKAVSDGIAEVVAGAPEDFDTLKEMSDWISTHETSASAMNSQIQDNKKAIDNHALNGDIHVTPENKTNWNKVSEKLDKTGDASNVTTEFTTATTRSNLTTKEKLSISLGKISKWFSDLKSVAFSGSYNDLNDKPTSLPASDVSAWAKESTKPTYTKAEVGLGNVDNTADSEKSVKYATSAGNATKVNNHTVNADVPKNAFENATSSTNGLMSFTDKKKVDNLDDALLSKLGESTEGTLTFNGSEIKTNTDYVADTLAEAQQAIADGLIEEGATVYVKEGTNDAIGVATESKTGLVKPDGTTITIDEDGTLHGSSTYTLPKATVEVLGGIKPDGKTTFVNEEGVLSAKGGGATITPKPTVNPQIKNDDKKVVITWEDPTDTVIEGSTFSKWAGTKLVMKESGYPTSPDDGTVLVDNTTRDKYKTTGFEKSGLTNDKQYYFALFPYSTDGVYNYDSGNRLLGEPTELKIVTFAGGTDTEIAKMIQAHYNNKINIADYWAVGDTRSVSLSAMAATGVGESHRAQTVQFVIGDFDHDDLATPINGHSKASVTLLQKDCLMDASGKVEPGCMNVNDTNSGGWKNCARRTWCNNVFFAALPSAWQSMVKTVNKKTFLGTSSTAIDDTQDKIFLASEIEIFGLIFCTAGYGEGAQYQYYKNSTANIFKMPKKQSSYNSCNYWERSPHASSGVHFCAVNERGTSDFYYAHNPLGIAPCTCI